MIGRAQAIPALSQRLRPIDRIVRERHTRGVARFGGDNPEGGMAAVQDEERTTLAGALDDCGHLGAELLSVDPARFGVHVQLEVKPHSKRRKIGNGPPAEGKRAGRREEGLLVLPREGDALTACSVCGMVRA